MSEESCDEGDIDVTFEASNSFSKESHHYDVPDAEVDSHVKDMAREIQPMIREDHQKCTIDWQKSGGGAGKVVITTDGAVWIGDTD